MTTMDDQRLAELIRATDPIAGAQPPAAADYTAVREQIMQMDALPVARRRRWHRALRARSTWIAPVVAVAATVAVVAIAASAGLWRGPTPLESTAATPPASSTPGVPLRVPMADLVGTWQITDSGTALDGAAFAISEWELTVMIDCGPVTAWWSPGSRALVTSAWWAYDGQCLDEYGFSDDIPEVEPLTRVAAYERSPRGWLLVDATGAAVAELRPIDVEATPWAEWHELRFRVDPEEWVFPPLADGLRPAAAGDLLGTWRREGTDEPGVTIADGTWTNNGCHGGSATFAVEPRGFLVTHTFATSADLCMPADTELRNGYAGFDGDVLVINDMRLERIGD